MKIKCGLVFAKIYSEPSKIFENLKLNSALDCKDCICIIQPTICENENFK